MKRTLKQQGNKAEGCRVVCSGISYSRLTQMASGSFGRLRRGLLSSALLAALCVTMSGLLFAREDNPQGITFNQTFDNSTGQAADAFHVVLTSAAPIMDLQTYASGGFIEFPSVTVTGIGTTSVEIDYYGASVNPGQTTHVGLKSSDAALEINVAKSWWSTGGLVNKPNPWDGTILTPNFFGDRGFTVVRTSLYDANSNWIGTDWAEGTGDFVSLVNATPDGPVFASYATLFSPTEIPLADLNPNLTGFGVESQIMEFEATGVPEPGSLALLGTGVVGLGGLLRRRFLGRSM